TVVSFMLSTVSPSVVVAPFWLLMLPSLRGLEVRNRGDAIPAARIVKRPARDGRAHGVFSWRVYQRRDTLPRRGRAHGTPPDLTYALRPPSRPDHDSHATDPDPAHARTGRCL